MTDTVRKPASKNAPMKYLVVEVITTLRIGQPSRTDPAASRLSRNDFSGTVAPNVAAHEIGEQFQNLAWVRVATVALLAVNEGFVDLDLEDSTSCRH